MIQAGSFREDLWYRLAVFTILLPRMRKLGIDWSLFRSPRREEARERYSAIFA